VVVAQLVPAPHPILGCADQVTQAVEAVAQVQPVYMTPVEKTDAVVALDRAINALLELQLRVVASAKDAADQVLARDNGAWLALVTHADPSTGRAEGRLAQALDTRWEQVRAGMAAGTVSVDQARVVVAALEALPADLDPALVTKAEAQMVAYCADLRPGELRKLGRHLLEVIAPEIAEAALAKRLDEEEQRARERCRLTLRPVGDGTTRLSGLLPDVDATRLRTYLEAFTSPRKSRDAAIGAVDRIPYPRRLGHAFCALLEHLDPKKLPMHGGDATTLMVTIGLDALRSDLAAGGVVGGEALSATEVRRMACNASIIPVVLGGKGEILDAGRARRLHPPHLRKLLRLRDQRCRAEGCTVPAAWTEAHHWKPWSEGGKTNLDDGILYCSWHHHRAHDQRFETDKLASGDIRFHRRT
jgi:hypothetical protein